MNIEIRVVLSANYGSEGFLLRRAHIFIITNMTKLLSAFITKEFLAFSKREPNFLARLWNEEFRRLVHGMNQGDLLLAPLFELLKYMKKETFEKVHDLMVVIFDFGFNVKASELSQACYLSNRDQRRRRGA